MSTNNNGRRPIYSNVVTGTINSETLDNFIESYLDENLEDAMYKVLARRSGISLDDDFQDKLNEIWDLKHNVGILRTTPQAGDTVRYSDDTPEYVRTANKGYLSGIRYWWWEMVEDD